jgi:DNA-binding transcriptional ArsR family regulator
MLERHVFQAIASPRRQQILRMIWQQERSAGAIHRAIPDVTFGAVSLQLRALDRAGLVEARTEGRHRYYRAKTAAFGEAAAWLERMWADALWRLKLDAELEQARRGPRARRTAGRKA